MMVCPLITGFGKVELTIDSCARMGECVSRRFPQLVQKSSVGGARLDAGRHL
jgi:hypothetical protein